MSQQENPNYNGPVVAKNQKVNKSKLINWIDSPQQSLKGLQTIEEDNIFREETMQSSLKKDDQQFEQNKDIQENYHTANSFKSISNTVTTNFSENMSSNSTDVPIFRLKSSHQTSISGQVFGSKQEQGNKTKANLTFKGYHQQFIMNDVSNAQQEEIYKTNTDNSSSAQVISPQINNNNNSGYQYLSYNTHNEVQEIRETNQSLNNFQQSGQVSTEIEGEERSSKVLLVIVQNPRDEVIQHKIIFNKFISFGNVEQILIFSKKQQWKFFVDMDSLENAVKARRYLDNSTINISGKDLRMRVQYSNQQDLQLKNGNPGGINYKELNSKFENTHLSYSSPIDSYDPTKAKEELIQVQKMILKENNNSSNDNTPLEKELKENSQEIGQISQEGSNSHMICAKGIENSSQDLSQNDFTFSNNIERPNNMNLPDQSHFQNISSIIQPIQQQSISTKNQVSLKNENLSDQLDDLLLQINNNVNEEDQDKVKQDNSFIGNDQKYPKKVLQTDQVQQNISVPSGRDNAPTKGLKKLDQLLGNCESQENSLVVSENDDEESGRVWSDSVIVFDSGSKIARSQEYNNFSHSKYVNSQTLQQRTQPQSQSDFNQNSAFQEPCLQSTQLSSSKQFSAYPTQLKSTNILQTINQHPSTSIYNNNPQTDNLPSFFNNQSAQINYDNQQQLSGQYSSIHQQNQYFSGNISSQYPPGINYSPSQRLRQSQNVTQSALGQDNLAQQSRQFQLQQSQQPFTGGNPQQQLFQGQLFNAQHKSSQNLSGQITGNQVVQENMGIFNGSTYVKQGFLEDSRPSKVIYINHLASPLIQLTHLYNVFSNFGDIVKISFKRAKGTAFIEYTTQEFATRSKDCMDKKIFFESDVRVFYSHFESLLNQQEDKQSEIFLGSEQTYRFLKDPKMTLNVPSLVIHISNLKQDICDHEKMHELFHPFGKIEAIHIEKNPPRFMCHLKFSQIKESLMAVAYMHNHEIKGRKMFLSFTRKKLESQMSTKI